MLECEGARGVWTLMIDSDTDSVVVISREGGVYTHQERWELPLLVDQILRDRDLALRWSGYIFGSCSAEAREAWKCRKMRTSLKPV